MLKIFYLLTFVIIDNFANNVNKELSKYPQNPSYFIQMLRSPDVIKNQFVLNNTRMKGENSNIPVTPQMKKQNVNRVSQKQYEVINMLWRKTKIFVDIEASTVTYQTTCKTKPKKSYTTHKNPFQISLPRPLAHISTPSYIEFYYIHEVDDRIKEKKSPNFNIDIRIAAKSGIKNSTQFIPKNTLFGLSNYYKQSQNAPYPPPINSTGKVKDNSNILKYVDFLTRKMSTPIDKSKFKNPRMNAKNSNKNEVTSFDILFGNETCPYTTTQDDEISTNKPISVKNLDKNRHYSNSQPFYAKIKSPEENEITYDKILEHMDQNTGHHDRSYNKTKHTKKHIDALVGAQAANDAKDQYEKNNRKVSIKPKIEMPYNKDKLNGSASYDLNSVLGNPEVTYNYVNNSASWIEYRFVAVYVYEPLQVHCDAAGISPHWLITAGSCLARHHKNPGGEGLSAYVTYCGDNWWNPERISYVKYSLVHPRYHPRNRIRRHLYNIGIIQVVNSMVSACPGWSPVSLMSHHFSASGVGSRATAVGWGLDRFDARYTVTDMPKRSLMMYDALVYSDSCPGNIGYSKAKQLDDEGGVKNVYCLSLPPYSGEENDPVHGSLLLVGEKLIALYLQEERRPWGEQCALYTGTWRLVPWVLDHARESDDSDIFTVDI